MKLTKQIYRQQSWWWKLGFWFNTGGATIADLPDEGTIEQ